MRSRVSRRLVVDASVARSAGGEDAVFPLSRQCRNFLRTTLATGHRAVLTRAVHKEWKKHESQYAREWRYTMMARKRLVLDDAPEDTALRDAIEASATTDRERRAMLKDVHLVEAAQATDRTVVSLDDTVRGLFAQAAPSVRCARSGPWCGRILGARRRGARPGWRLARRARRGGSFARGARISNLHGDKGQVPPASPSRLLDPQLAPLADRLLAREAAAATADHTEELRRRLAVSGIAGQSRALAEVFRQVLVAAPVPVAVLITGESGTGKTAIARALHDSSARAAKPFVELNCAAIPETLFESELFGAEKGAHSTATRRIEGKVDAARGGTLFLDEVGEMPFGVQSKLLTFLQSRRYYRLGGAAPIEADVRVVAATNADLPDLVQQKRFREDLYYRLNVLEVRVPPLRDRPEDIAPIAERLVKAFGEAHDRVVPLSRAARLSLAESEWPGNVRQLENVVQRGWAVALSEGAAAIEPRHLFPEKAAGPEGPATYEDAMRRYQGRFLREALEQSGWNVSETARRTGLARSHLNDLIKAHGLTRGRKQ